MIIATFNVENLFDRAKALMPTMGGPGDNGPVLEAHAEINELFNRDQYDAATKDRILALLANLDLLESDTADLVILRVLRGKLLTRRNTGVEIVANGRSDWIGWVELRTEIANERAMEHTALVMNELQAEVLGVVEAESRPTLQMFSAAMLKKVGGRPYEHCMLVEGNDDRGIDVGLFWRDRFSLAAIRSHVYDRDSKGAIFSRDCCEYHLIDDDGVDLVILANHFKSKGYSSPDDPGGSKRRKRQAKRVAEIYEGLRQEDRHNVVVLGDFNDTPDSASLKPLVVDTDLRDISEHEGFDWASRHGTYGSSNTDKIDYILLSPALFDRVKGGGVFRKGVFHPPGTHNPWEMFPSLESKVQEASDHAAVWADIGL